MLYERNNGTSSNSSLIFDTGKTLLNFDCHSIALNDPETHLLLVSNHELAFINFESITSQIDNTIGDDSNVFMPSLSDIKSVPLFDTCNINRPIVEWNHSDTNQYAVAIDRLVRLYTVDHSRINETNAIIDSQHQVSNNNKKRSALAGSRTRVGCLEGNHANRYTTNASIREALCYYSINRFSNYFLAPYFNYILFTS